MSSLGEQARGPHPSRQILAALARALLLTADEREYLFRVAGESPPPAASPSREISPGIRNLIDSLPETPAYVVDAKYDVLAWNTLATHFIGDLESPEGLLHRGVSDRAARAADVRVPPDA